MAPEGPPAGLIAGKYRLSTLIGRGGMGSVWEGTHATLGTHVAVKFIESEYAGSPEARSRFENEARAAAKLRSKHVVEVYDHGMTDDGRPFIVMEYLRGEPLDKRLDRLGRLPAKDTARLLMQVCRALSKAHAAGIVHRDLKPENVFLVWDDEDGADVAKVVDFGIAKFTDSHLGNSSATRTGSVLGTPYYMSPEQARGLRSVDYRSDLWSVGVIAYRCIVGTLPFEGEAVGDLLVKLCTAPLPIPSRVAPDAVPPGFDAWFAKALSREPEGRFKSASELAESLAAVCGLSVRAAYATADIPIASHAGGPAASPSPAMTPGPIGFTPPPGLTPMPGHRGERTAQSPIAAGASGQGTLQMATGAPTSQTAGPVTRKNTGAVIAAALTAVVVLGIGAAVAIKTLTGSSGGPAPTSPPAAEPPAVTAPVAPPVNPAPTSRETAEPVPAAVPAASSANSQPAGPVRPVRPQPVPAPVHPGKPTKPGKPAGGPAPADVGF